MYRVLIVDDEPLVRRGIRRSINWNELDIEMVAEAANGVEALAQYLQDEPDIILLDINMPKMNGLEFASIVKRTRPGCRVVFLTGHNDFEFARSALRIGVDDYILKPVTRDGITQVLEEQISRINDRASEAAYERSARGRAMALELNSLLRGGRKVEADAASFEKRYGMAEIGSIRFVIMRDYLSGCGIWSDGDTDELAQFAALNIAEEILEREKAGFAFTTYKDEMAMILAQGDRECAQTLESIRSNILDFLEIPVDFGVSERGTLGELQKLAEQSRRALECSFVLHDSPLLVYEEVEKKKCELEKAYPVGEEKNLLDHMFAEEPERTLGRIDALFEALSRAAIEMRQSKRYLLRLLVTLHNTIESVTTWTDGQDSEIAEFDPVTEVDSFTSLGQAHQWFRDYYIRAYNYVHRMRSRTGQHYMNIRGYIEKNYANSDVNLKRCSEELYLSTSYISMILKKESGKTFIDHLNEYRIQKAAQLLRQPGSRIYDVSEKVGFMHPTYFSSVFKKIMGITPTQYKENGPSEQIAN